MTQRIMVLLVAVLVVLVGATHRIAVAVVMAILIIWLRLLLAANVSIVRERDHVVKGVGEGAFVSQCRFTSKLDGRRRGPWIAEAGDGVVAMGELSSGGGLKVRVQHGRATAVVAVQSARTRTGGGPGKARGKSAPVTAPWRGRGGNLSGCGRSSSEGGW